ncbi:MAG: branched chain amino acid aminotransferase [Actinobacteria bacterium RBG_16_67_10]|jgi:branched-chain amino acid aminotransferase|nr:MAG: branched chain amino acid aminotransferase [Actinobacteria bacterium RBG_16_67_10]
MEPTKFIWFDGEMVPWDQATVHVLSHGLHYGTGVFEGIRVYDTPDGSAAFRLTDHMKRLVGSAKAFRIPLKWTLDQLTEAALDLVRANGLPAVYLRPIVFLGTGSLGLNPTGAGVHAAIGSWVWGAYLGAEGIDKGIRVRVSSWRRVGHEAMVPNAKGTGQYVNSVMAKQEAITAGYDEAILLNTAGYVVEGSGENLFLVRDGVVRTPATSMGALAGITRDTVMTLLADDGLDVAETPMTRADLYYADESFFTGTAAEVTPIREIDDRVVGSGAVGAVTRRAQELFAATVTGRLEQYRHWLEFA